MSPRLNYEFDTQSEMKECLFFYFNYQNGKEKYNDTNILKKYIEEIL